MFFVKKERKIKPCCKEPLRTPSRWHPSVLAGPWGSWVRIWTPTKGPRGREWVANSLITWDREVPSMGTGAVFCQPCPGTLMSPGRVGELRKREAWSTFGRGCHPGGDVARAWLLPDMPAGDHRGSGDTRRLGLGAWGAEQQIGQGKQRASR